MTMSASNPTAKITNDIAAFVRAGGHPEVAAEAAGVPRDVFLAWMRRADLPRAGKAVRDLAAAVRTAAAQARLTAETEVRSGKPLDWLKSSPNRDAPAWTTPARPAGAIPDMSLDDPRVRLLITIALSAFADDPGARRKLADSFAKSAMRPL